MASDNFRQWLEMGKALADEFASKKPSKKRKQKRTAGSSVSWRTRDRNGYIVPKYIQRNRSVKPTDMCERHNAFPNSMEVPEVEDSQMGEIPQEVPNFDQHLQTLRDLLSSVTVPVSAQVEETPSMSVWTRRQLTSEKNFKAALPEFLSCMLAAESVPHHCCQQCKTVDAVVRCLDCVPSGVQFLCASCDLIVHKKCVFHDREVMVDGFYKPIPPTSSVKMSERGHHELVEQVCLLPIPPPTQICSCGCNQDLAIIPGKQTVLVTINGPYNLCLPIVRCPCCSFKWTPGISDLIRLRYWPATASCQTLFKFDVFTSFEQMKLASPATSQKAFIRMLEHRAHRTGRMGSICGDTFHKVYREFSFCNWKKEHLCLVEPFICPACTPDMLAISADGNRKHYRFKKSMGTDEQSLFDGLFIAQDAKVSAFVDQIRSHMILRTGHDVCGPATFTAGRETAQKFRAKVDEEGLEIAVCRHGMLLQGLNHYRGEIYAYPLFLQKELAERANIKFFCMDLTCRYWPYLEKMAEKLPELQPLTEMKPFLSVMHAKAHTGKCEVRWGGRNQEGAGNTVGEEVEQVNSFLSRAALTTKYMTKSGRGDMLTMLAMGWNNRKVESLHKTLAKRFVKSTQRAETETANLERLQHELNIDHDDTEKWVEDVKQWAATEKHGARSSQEELQREIEDIIYSLRRKKHDLYRQNDSNQTRQRKRRRLGELKKKLREMIMQYNAVATSAQNIDAEAACSLSDVLLPWEAQGDVVSLRLKRRVFDQVMLVRRIEEERLIVVKEMTQHYQYLRNALDKLQSLLHHTEENIKNNEMTEAGYRGLHCCLLQKRDALQKKLSELASTYSHVDTDSVFLMVEEDVEDCEEDDSSSELSEEEL
ncbi:uncharacterized protein LOC110971783 isoform X2 [Acanthochromis polyacanthus]|uniref:uncharacterized protein LOC110971783 isoform X2 n=1 Tax=Acanthochromis polyacanthus TaxID=80966 RepID=UPI0022348792|nr:uncharacterized protein LOC110971783 isoform X2 [Acanthochromis polyacanthus]